MDKIIHVLTPHIRNNVNKTINSEVQVELNHAGWAKTMIKGV